MKLYHYTYSLNGVIFNTMGVTVYIVQGRKTYEKIS